MADANELAQLLGQIQAAAAEASSALTEISGLKTALTEANEKIKALEALITGFKITDDSGIVSGSGNQWRINFSNLPDPILTATVDCDTDPPTITITSTNG
jgi:hypothetical protein